jgi:hypothetical protein
MRIAMAGSFLLAVLSCNSAFAEPLVGDGTLTSFLKQIANPGSLQRDQDNADDAKCRKYGFQPQTEAYGNCRLQLEQIRATKEAGDWRRR